MSRYYTIQKHRRVTVPECALPDEYATLYSAVYLSLSMLASDVFSSKSVIIK